MLTLMNVGPARCIWCTRNPYHHTAPHRSPPRFFLEEDCPTKIMGAVIITGAKRATKCKNRTPVHNGSHIRSRNKSRIRCVIDLRSSLGDDIWWECRSCCDESEHGMTVGDASMAGTTGCSEGMSSRSPPPTVSGMPSASSRRRRAGGRATSGTRPGSACTRRTRRAAESSRADADAEASRDLPNLKDMALKSNVGNLWLKSGFRGCAVTFLRAVTCSAFSRACLMRRHR